MTELKVFPVESFLRKVALTLSRASFSVVMLQCFVHILIPFACRIYNGNEANSYQADVQKEFDQWLQDRVLLLVAPVMSDYVPWLRFYCETVLGWRSRLEDFRDREMALFEKMMDLETRRQRAAEREADESYVPDFVDVMLGAPMDDGKVLEDQFIIKQLVVRIRTP